MEPCECIGVLRAFNITHTIDVKCCDSLRKECMCSRFTSLVILTPDSTDHCADSTNHCSTDHCADSTVHCSTDHCADSTALLCTVVAIRCPPSLLQHKYVAHLNYLCTHIYCDKFNCKDRALMIVLLYYFVCVLG